MITIMICNICGQEMITHKYEELDICDECQLLINKELAKPVVKESWKLLKKRCGMVTTHVLTLIVMQTFLQIL